MAENIVLEILNLQSIILILDPFVFVAPKYLILKALKFFMLYVFIFDTSLRKIFVFLSVLLVILHSL